MEATLKHCVEYEIVDAVDVDDLVKSIEAHSRLMKAAGTLLSEIVPGLKIETKKVSVVHLSQQSPLKELFALSIVMAYQKDLEEEVPALIEALTGSQIPDQYDSLVTVLVMLVAVYGVSKAYEILFPGKSKENLKNSENNLANKAAGHPQKPHELMAA